MGPPRRRGAGRGPRFAILDHASAVHASATEALELLPVGEPSELPLVNLDGLTVRAHAEFLLSVASSFEAKCRAAATILEE